MTLQVTDLNNNPMLSVCEGQDYLVPCVWGIPVICPSHVDEGTEGPTSKHWHTDDRFGNVGRGIEFWTPECQKRLRLNPEGPINASTLRDDGQPVFMERKTAQKTVIRPTGALETSLAWLYKNLGQKSAENNCCAHQGTPLVEQDGCLTCPAHGLKYGRDGGPRYKAPFFISVRYINYDDEIHYVREPVETKISFTVLGDFDPFPTFRLEDSEGVEVFQWRLDTSLSILPPGGATTLNLHMPAWSSQDYGAPQLVQTDPREKVK